eukprot:jgi/Undpi1/4296/HiC_scaffold_17.g07662.m1
MHPPSATQSRPVTGAGTTASPFNPRKWLDEQCGKISQGTREHEYVERVCRCGKNFGDGSGDNAEEAKKHEESDQHTSVNEDIGETKTVWQKEGYHVDYTKCPYIPDDRDDITEYAELASTLNNPMGQHFLGGFSAEINTLHLLCAWSDILEYEVIPVTDYRYTKALKIFRKYLLPGPGRLNFVPEAVVESLHKCLIGPKAKENIGGSLFLDMQRACFRQLFDTTFMTLKTEYAERYQEYLSDNAQRFNRIHVDDFHYLESLGQGAFGTIVHVVKKTTGRHYAMKVQYKKDLLRHFARNPRNVDNEKIVYEKCHHPFVLRMDYAFQTEHHAIIVLNLVTTGNIQEAIEASPGKRMDQARVVFYVAEIILALIYLHEMGLMYR